MTNLTQTRTVVVTGASGGFGRMTAETLAVRGWRVLAVTRQAGIEIAGCEVVTLNVSAPEAGQVLAERVGGRLDVLINNAGYGLSGPLEGLSDAQIAEQFDVNVLGLARVTRDLLPALRATRGAIVNLSSVLGYAGMPFMGLYCASKFAVEGLSESLFYELQPHGVRVHIVEPGGFRSHFSDNKHRGAGGVYDQAFRGLEARIEGRAAEAMPSGGPRDPIHVVRRIVALAEGRRGGLRHRVGLDAQATYFVRRLLPQGVADAVLSFIYRQLTR